MQALKTAGTPLAMEPSLRHRWQATTEPGLRWCGSPWPRRWRGQRRAAGDVVRWWEESAGRSGAALVVAGAAAWQASRTRKEEDSFGGLRGDAKALAAPLLPVWLQGLQLRPGLGWRGSVSGSGQRAAGMWGRHPTLPTPSAPHSKGRQVSWKPFRDQAVTMHQLQGLSPNLPPDLFGGLYLTH